MKKNTVTPKSRFKKILALLLIFLILASHSNGNALFGVLADDTDKSGDHIAGPEEPAGSLPDQEGEDDQEGGGPEGDPLAGEPASNQGDHTPGLPQAGGPGPAPMGGDGTPPDGDDGQVIEVSTLDGLLKALTGDENATVRMVADIYCDFQSLTILYPTITKEIVWDFNQHKLTLHSDNNVHIAFLIHKIEQGASLTMVNAQVEESLYMTQLIYENLGRVVVRSTAGTGVSCSCFISENSGNLMVESGRYESKREFIFLNTGAAEFRDVGFLSSEESTLIYRNDRTGYATFFGGSYDLKGNLVTLNDGALAVADTDIKAEQLISLQDDPASFSLENSKIEANRLLGQNGMRNIGDDGQAARVTIKSGEFHLSECLTDHNKGIISVYRGAFETGDYFIAVNHELGIVNIDEATIEIEGYDPSGSPHGSSGNLFFYNYGQITISDGEFTSKDTICHVNGGEIAIDGGTFTSENDFLNTNTGRLIITGGTFLVTKGYFMFENASTGQVIVEGGTFSNFYSFIWYCKGSLIIGNCDMEAECVVVEHTGQATLKSGIYTLETAILNGSKGWAAIEGGTYQVSNGVPVACKEGSETFVSGGTFTGTYGDGIDGGALHMLGGSATLTGGLFTNTTGKSAFYIAPDAELIIPETHVAYPPDWEATGASVVEIFTAGDLEVSNTVTGTGADPTKPFSYAVVLDKKLINGWHGDMLFRDGIAEFKLKDGQSKKAGRLPAGTGYLIIESDYQGYVVSVLGEAGNEAKGEIPEGDAALIPFENQVIPGGFTVSKTVEHYGKDKSFFFRASLTDKTISGVFGDLTFEDGIATFVLGHGESITASGLPVGMGFSVVEYDYGSYDVSVNGQAGDNFGGVIEPDTNTGIHFLNSYVSPIITVTGEKIWLGGEAPRPPVWFKLYRRSGPFSAAVPGAEIKELSGDTTHVTWEVEETNPSGSPYTYFIREVDEDGMPFTPEGYAKTENGMKVWNTFQDPLQETTTVVARKLWVGGDGERPEVWFKLYRRIEVAGALAEEVPDVSLGYLPDGTELAIWKHLPKADLQGRPYHYYVQEVDENGEDYVPENYVKFEAGLLVVNTYQEPGAPQATTTVVARKVWAGGPLPRPDIYFKLYRSSGGGDPEPVEDAEPGYLPDGVDLAIWEHVPKADQGGQDYTYSVREVDMNGDPYTPAGYEKQEDGLTVTNAYVIQTIDVTARKVWVGGSGTRPTVWFQLFRTEGHSLAKVGQPQKLEDGTTEVVWPSLAEYSQSGVPFTYWVHEVDAEGHYFTPPGYEKQEDGLTVTNTYVLQTIDVTAYKIWEGGPEPRPTVWFQLFRTEGHTLAKVGQPQKLEDGTTEVVWPSLAEYSQGGVPFTYWVHEVNAEGHYYPPPGYEKQEDGLTVTNTYVKETIDVTAHKFWIDEEDEHPTVWFQLFRSDGASIEKVRGPQELADGTTEITWLSLAKYASNGEEYYYWVFEVDADGNSYTPQGYEKYEDGLTVTNTLQIHPQQTVSVVARKSWVGGNGPRPDVWFKLYRRIELAGALAEEVPGVDLGHLPDGTELAIWKHLPKADGQGNAYIYSVREVDQNGHPFAPHNYEKEEMGLTVINTFAEETIDVTAYKFWIDQEDEHPTVWFQLFRADASSKARYGDPQPLVNGVTEVTWTGLAKYGHGGSPFTYWVREMNAQGEYKAPDGYEKYEDGLTVTNTRKTEPGQEVSVVARKVWVGGDGPRPGVWFKLYRRIELAGALAEEVPGVDLGHLPDGTELAIWKHLPKADGQGNAYIYSVREVDQDGVPFTPHDYEKEEIGLTVINTFVGETMDVEATKTWELSTGIPPTVWFQLYRSMPDGLKVKVGSPRILEDGATKVTWEGVARYGAPGIEYVYSVMEVDADGHPFTPEGYEKEEKGLTVTNRHVGETIDVEATKVWVGGEGPRPPVWFQLMRSVGLVEAVVGRPRLLEDGATSIIWESVAKYDQAGHEYVYYVTEVDENGADYVPAGYEKDEDGLTVTNYRGGMTKDVRAEKIWADGPDPRPTVWFQLWRSDGLSTDAVDGPRPLLHGTLSLTWNDQPRYGPSGNLYDYWVTEVDAEGYPFVPVNYEKEEEGLTVTNRYVSPRIEVTGKKIWSGDAGPRPTVWFQLYRVSGGISGKVPGAEIKELGPGTEEVFWEVDQTNPAGLPYEFFVREVDAGEEPFVPFGYAKTESGMTVWNTYAGETIEITAEKIWEGEGGPKPSVWFQLWRSAGESRVKVGDPRLLADGTLEVTWPGLAKYFSEDNEYSYSVTEVDADGNDFAPDGYTKLEKGLTVTNTYTGETMDVTAEKIWVGDTGPRPDIWFQLWRSDGQDEVEIGGPQLLEDGTLEVTWPGLAKYFSEDNEYSYFVTEVDADGNDFAPDGYTKLENNLTVTNTYAGETIDVTAEKIWVGDTGLRPDIWFQLWRSDGGSPARAGDPELVDDETDEVTWSGLAEFASPGVAYIYTVTEVDAGGADYVPYGYSKVEHALTVTNTYIGETMGVTAEKIWVGDIGPRPDIWFQLWRSDGLGNVKVGEPQLLEYGTLEVTWTGLAKYFSEGNEYSYKVTEVDDDGNDFVPDSYTKLEEGLTVTNTYAGETIDVRAEKIWVGDIGPRPDIWFQLWRSDGGSPARVGDPELVGEGTDEVTWSGLAEFASPGVAYIYTVTEVDAGGADYVPYGYSKVEDGLTVTNTYTSETMSVEASKVWAGGETPHPRVWF